MANDENWETYPYIGTVMVKKGYSDDHGEIWTYAFGTAGQSDQWPGKNLCQALAWIVQQLHLGNYEVRGEEDGEVVSVLIGQGAPLNGGVEDKALGEFTEALNKHLHERSEAVNLCGIFAQAREQGIQPKFEKTAEKVKRAAKIGMYANTEIHYAFQLIGILKRIRERSFVLDSPPILGRAPRPVVQLLGEATRCHLHGFHQACVAICRACLEQSLKERVPQHELLQERWNNPKSGELECLISGALRVGSLDGPRRQMADEIRKNGNVVLHRMQEPGEDSWDILQHTRGVVSYLYRNAGEAAQ